MTWPPFGRPLADVVRNAREILASHPAKLRAALDRGDEAEAAVLRLRIDAAREILRWLEAKP